MGYFIGDFFIGDVDFGDFDGVLGIGDTDLLSWVICNGDMDLFLVTLGVVTLMFWFFVL